MRRWMGPVLGLALAIALASGCARRPCPIIPMQLELAQTERDRLAKQVEQKEAEKLQAGQNLETTLARVAQMTAERDELLRLLDEDGGGTPASGRAQ